MRLIILSRNAGLYSSRRLLEAARSRGHEARVIDHLRCDLLIEKNEPAVFYHGERLEPVDAIIPRNGA